MKPKQTEGPLECWTIAVMVIIALAVFIIKQHGEAIDAAADTFLKSLTH